MLLLTLWICPAALAHDRLTTLYDWRNGLDAGMVTGVAQDPAGFIWVSTRSGLMRFDGRRFVRVTDRPGAVVDDRSISGPVYVFDEGIVKRIQGDDLIPLIDSAGATTPHLGTWSRTTEDGSLWLVRGNGAMCVRPDGALSPNADVRVDGNLTPVGAGHGADLLAWSEQQLWSVSPGGAKRSIARVKRPVLAVASDATHSVIALFWPGEVRRLDARGERIIATGLGRPLDLLERGGATWASFDSGLYRIGSDDTIEQISATGEISGGEQLLLDRENNLWMSNSGSGLLLFPEPETIHFRLGPGPFLRSVVFDGEAPWFGAWWGTFRIFRGPRGWEKSAPIIPGWSKPAVDDRGRIWGLFDGRFQIWDGGKRVGEALVPDAGSASCANPTRDHGLWIPTDGGLFHLPPRSDRVERVLDVFPAGTPQSSNEMSGVFESSSGEIFLASGEWICRGNARSLERREDPGWRCDTIPGATYTAAFGELPGLGVLASVMDLGVMRFHDGVWSRLPPAGSLRPDLPCHSIKPGADGTLWLMLEQGPVRIRARSDLPAGYEVVERMSSLQGGPHAAAIDLTEDGSGGLWVALSLTVAYMPPQARSRTSVPWPARLVGASVDGRPLPLDSKIELPYSRNRLELRFAALSFSEPSAIRYRMRLHDDEAWGEPVVDPDFRFVDLPAGSYDIAVQAATDGVQWHEDAARLSFRVLRPWYLQAWFIVLAGCCLAALAYAWYRMRLAAVVSLERQRARIAMDLHDEIGAGLGGIGLMTGLAARTETNPERRIELAGRAAAIASTLASSLQDIVWSLRPGAARLESLAAHIVDRGQALFADGTPEFISEIPERLPPVPLSLSVRRDVLLIAQEAMHNARRHAGARRVTLRLEPQGRLWRLTVTDDGEGLPVTGGAAHSASAAGTTRGRFGLESMRARAAQLGAAIEWRELSAGGTAVVLVFDPVAEPRAGS